MSQIAHPDVAAVVNQLDSVGQKYRLQRMARGAMLFVAITVVVSVMAGLMAHGAGGGRWAMAILALWIGLVGAAAVMWVVRPMLIRPRNEWVARFIESRVEGLHNGLTNALRLSAREDIQASPFTPLIYLEIRTRADAAPLQSAIQWKDLSTVAWRSVIAIGLALVLAILFRQQLAHGWRQMISPAAFVPNVAEAEIVSIRPGNTTLIRGQPLEILLETAKLDASIAAQPKLFLDPPVDGKSSLDLPTVAPDRFAARIDHVDHSLRYRVEVQGTQSAWFDVKVIDQIKLTELSLNIVPPAYTKQANQTIKVDLSAATQAVNVSQGSRLEIAATLDNAVSTGMLQLDDDAPLPLERLLDGKRYIGSTQITKDRSVSLLLADGSGQILARLPEPAIQVRSVPDAAPSINMTWPAQDLSVPLDSPLEIKAVLRDDIGLTGARIVFAVGPDAPLAPAIELPLQGIGSYDLAFKLDVPAAQRAHGSLVRVQVEAVDNRNLSASEGKQTSQSPVYELRFRDPKELAKESQERLDKLRAALTEMLKKQQDLHTQTIALPPTEKAKLPPITQGQTELRDRLTKVAETFSFSPAEANVQKTLFMLAKNPAQEAIDFSQSLATEPAADQLPKIHKDLQARQRRIISTLESLLAMLVASPEMVEQKTTKGGDLPSKESMEKLKAALDEYMKQQQKLLDSTSPLAKKPVDDFTDKEKKDLADLTMSQEKLDAFMQEKIADFSKLAEQDMANASLLKELMEVYSEVTMAKDALKKKEMEIAVAAEEMGLELAKAIVSNLEKWLVDSPDRIKWDQEDPLAKADIPMAELPKELEDMLGELMEQQEDILEEAEDTNANWTDSLDKGAGWDAADGPIANMSAKGVTGNQLPNNNEMGGRSGEGRSGKSQGEFVEDTATGKGGRNTPTRLDPTPFQQGQVKDESKDPVGGATGGGKMSGQGGEGLEGPVPPGIDKEMQRLAQKQAQLRNAAERLNLQYQLGKYDNFKLLESIAIMRRVEADLKANRYQNAMRRKDVLLDNMETSRMLVGGEIHVQHDSTPTLNAKMEDQIHDAMKGELPPAWSDALKTYYEKLGKQ